MKRLVKQFLYGNVRPVNFPAFRSLDGDIQEVALFSAENVEMDVSRMHCIVSQTPFKVAIYFRDGWHTSETGELTILRSRKKLSTVALKLQKLLEQPIGAIAIFEVTGARCFQPSTFRQFFLSRLFLKKRRISAFEGDAYGALYSYPRSVVAVCFKESDYYNIFPMDFKCLTDDVCILGLRTTNITLKKMIEAGKVVIGDTNGATLKMIYGLGNHHSSTPPPIDALPFKVHESKLFKFPVPDFCTSYCEVAFYHHEEIGSHTLLIGRIVYRVSTATPPHYLYHYHYFGHIGAAHEWLQTD